MTFIKKHSGVNNSFPVLFDDLFAKELFGFTPAKSYSNFSKNVPAVNILETEHEFKIEVAAPGVKKDDFKVEFEDGMLSISSETKQEQENKDENGKYTRREFSFSSFKRSFTIDEETIDTEKMEAKYEDGVLNILVPKKVVQVVEKKAKTIAVS